jgi:NAD(P)-dependent dehydrogenase (short-subunit alcohol dehydrogenase family)
MSIDYSSFQLNDKIAIVTGPSQGIGRAIALGLARAGAHLVLAEHPALHQEALQEVKREIEDMGRKALVVPTDISSVAQIRAMVDKAKETFGRIDILVNNASWTCTGPAIDTTEEDYDGTMDTNVKNVFFACQAAARVMIPQGGGRIVNIGSNFAVSAFRTRAVYAAAKAGVHQLSRALSLEWAKQGVVVNVVAPCITETPSRKPILDKPGYKEWVTNDKLPSGRWNQPEDLVGAVLFLVSPQLSAQVVGHVLMVDGGWTIH